MSKAYRAFEGFVCSLGDRLIKAKFTFSEWHSIFQKRRLYADVKWSAEQRKEFREFYVRHYGREFSNRWHRLYQSMNGTYCLEYFPEILYTLKLEKKLNPVEYSDVLCDKGLLNVIWGSVPGVRTIREHVTSCNGVLRDGDYNPITPSRGIEILRDAGKVCVKPTVETGSGKGVRFPVFNNGRDEKSGQEIGEILKGYGKDYTVQEYLQEHDSFSALHPSSVNTIRIITYILDGVIRHVPLAARIGSGGSDLDNIHAGGLCVGVNDDGSLKPRAFRLGYGDNNETFTEHPDSHIVFERHRLQSVGRIIEAACRMHARTPQLGIISWDFTVDKEGTPVLIEANLKGQSIWFPQIVNCCSAFGEHTGRILELIRG